MVDLVLLGVAVILIGFLLVFLATIGRARAREGDDEERKTSVRSGGVMMIGPIPIIFGSDAKWTSIAIILAIILVVLSFLFMQPTALRP